MSARMRGTTMLGRRVRERSTAMMAMAMTMMKLKLIAKPRLTADSPSSSGALSRHRKTPRCDLGLMVSPSANRTARGGSRWGAADTQGVCICRGRVCLKRILAREG